MATGQHIIAGSSPPPGTRAGAAPGTANVSILVPPCKILLFRPLKIEASLLSVWKWSELEARVDI